MPLIFQYSLTKSDHGSSEPKKHAVAADARASRSRSAASARRSRSPTRCRCRPCSRPAPTAGTWAPGGCGPTPRRRSARGRSCSACRSASTSGMKFVMSELPPGLVWKWKTRSCFSQASKHSSAIAASPRPTSSGLGLPPSRKVVLSATTRDSLASLSALRVISALRGRNETQIAAEDAVVGRRGLHHDVVEVEGDLVHRDAVVGHRERALDLELVHVVLDELGGRSVVVDRRLDRVLEVVELPRRDLADVAVARR